jgi:CheY-like chemotaxis protein
MQPNRQILVVDDNDDMREAVVELLRDHGYDVLEAADGEQGLQVLRSHRNIGLVVLDLMMPVMNGATFRWRQRWEHSIADVPVLVVSSVVDGGKSAEILGAQGHLLKPFEASALLAMVERTVARHASRKRVG